MYWFDVCCESFIFCLFVVVLQVPKRESAEKAYCQCFQKISGSSIPVRQHFSFKLPAYCNIIVLWCSDQGWVHTLHWSWEVFVGTMVWSLDCLTCYCHGSAGCTINWHWEASWEVIVVSSVCMNSAWSYNPSHINLGACPIA